MGNDVSTAPIMALMGAANQEWGGPVTLGQGAPTEPDFQVTETDLITGRSVYHGPELYYAYGVPTGVKALTTDFATKLGSNNEPGDLTILDALSDDVATSGIDVLLHFRSKGKILLNPREIGIVKDDTRDPRSWVLFPTLRIPMLINNIVGDKLEVTLAPNLDSNLVSLSGFISDLDEVHLVQAVRLYRDAATNELRHVAFGSDYTKPETNTETVLARGIVGLHFLYEPETKLLTMFIAAQGDEPAPTAGRAGKTAGNNWPAFAGDLPEEVWRHRVVVDRVSWRIRN
jgi:hypothetical protein